jgi:hypothetical protein
MNPLSRRIQSYIMSNMALKQYMQDHDYPSEIAGLILAIGCELIEWTLICHHPDGVIFMVENDLFVWGRCTIPSMGSVYPCRSPDRIVNDKRRELVLTDMERVKRTYACRSTLRNNNIVLSGIFDGGISLCEMSVPNVKRIFLGHHTAFVLTHSGDVYGCGRNDFYQLGHQVCMPQKSLVKINVPNGSKIVKIACGVFHTLFLTEMGTIYACGSNGCGQLGTGIARELRESSCNEGKPLNIELSHVIDICCGGDHSMSITSDGHIHAWGSNYAGQLGVGDTINRTTPELVTFPEF